MPPFDIEELKSMKAVTADGTEFRTESVTLEPDGVEQLAWVTFATKKHEMNYCSVRVKLIRVRWRKFQWKLKH